MISLKGPFPPKLRTCAAPPGVSLPPPLKGREVVAPCRPVFNSPLHVTNKSFEGGENTLAKSPTNRDRRGREQCFRRPAAARLTEASGSCSGNFFRLPRIYNVDARSGGGDLEAGTSRGLLFLACVRPSLNRPPAASLPFQLPHAARSEEETAPTFRFGGWWREDHLARPARHISPSREIAPPPHLRSREGQ